MKKMLLFLIPCMAFGMHYHLFKSNSKTAEPIPILSNSESSLNNQSTLSENESNNAFAVDCITKIAGNVFQDDNFDGILDAGETGRSGIEVFAYDCDDNLIGTATTDALGEYEITETTTGVDYRIEFVIPASLADTAIPTIAGADNASMIQFAQAGSCVNFGVINPETICLPYTPISTTLGNPFPDGKLLGSGMAFISCGTVVNLPPDDRYTVGVVDMRNIAYANDRPEINPTVYHHPSWRVDSIGNIFGVDTDKDGNMYAAASSHYAAAFGYVLGANTAHNATAVLRYGEIGGGASDLGAAGTVYKLDAVTGQASVFVQLPQQEISFTARQCESPNESSPRSTGPGLGNMTYDEIHDQFFVANFEDGAIYRIASDGTILNSFDPQTLAGFAPDDGTPGWAPDAKPYGMVVSPDGSQLFFGTHELDATPNVYSVNIDANGDFSGTEVFHTELMGEGDLGYLYAVEPSWIAISDLEFLPDGNLMVGMRTGCYGEYGTSHNHGATFYITNASDPDGLYNDIISNPNIQYPDDATANDDGYGGMDTWDKKDGTWDYIVSSSDTKIEEGPHGMIVFPHDFTNGASTGSTYGVSPSAAIPYIPSLNLNDIKGVGGDISVFSACDYNPLAIGNYIWEDQNKNGLQDACEPGLEGIMVKLFDLSGNLLATTTTDTEGHYFFQEDGIAGQNWETSGDALAPNTTYYVAAGMGQITNGILDLGGNSYGLTADSLGVGPTGNQIDSDGELVVTSPGGGFDGLVATTVTTGNFGTIDYAIDFGFIPCPTASPAAMSACDDGTGTGIFDLTTIDTDVINGQIGVTVAWYTDAAGTNAIATPTAYSSSVGTVYATLIDDISNCESATAAVSLTLTPSNITPSVIAADQTICSGDDPAAFTEVSPASSPGTLTYQWQSSTTDCTTGFTDIAGATNSTYDPPALTTTTYYHVVITSTLGGEVCHRNSNCVTVTINDIDPGAIGSDQTICEGDTPSALSFTTAPTGGTIAYQWQSSTTDCSTGFTNIAGENAATFTPPALTVNTFYRAIVTSSLNGNDCSATTNCVTMTVVPATPTATVDTNPINVCSEDSPYVAGADNIYDLNNLITGGDMTGTWSTTNATAAANLIGSTYTATTDLEGQTVTFVYTLPNNGAPCTDNTYNALINVMDCYASLGGETWIDSNGDGDNNENGTEVSNIKVILFPIIAGVKGTMITMQETDGTGNYQFDLLPPGDYAVQFDLNNSTNSDAGNYQFTAQNTTIATNDSDAASDGCTGTFNLTPSEENITADAGVYEPIEIGNFVWDDLNGNGIQNSGEPGIQGIDVTISGTTGDGTDITTLIPNTTISTAANGAYVFTNLPPGTYKITFDQPAGVSSTGANVNSNNNDESDSDAVDMGGMLMSQMTTIASGMVDTTIDAGFYTPVQIGNFVWEDLNGDGLQDSNEPGISGVDVTLSGTTSLGVDIGLLIPNTTVQTGIAGEYGFSDLPPGTYKVTFGTPTDMVPTTANINSNGNDESDSDAVDMGGSLMSQFSILTSGMIDETLDAGFYTPVEIGNFVWDDLNGNGIQDNGEPGIQGADVTISGTTGDGTDITTLVPNATIQTDSNGAYTFTNLPPGTYKVTFGIPVNMTATTANINGNGNDGTDSDATSMGGMLMSPMTTIPSGMVDTTLDAGFYTPVQIGNFIWEDSDANGIQDNGESGIPNINVTISGTTGDGTDITTLVPNATIQTDSNGEYVFTNLPPGTYKITFDTPVDMVATTANINTNGNDESDSDAIDMGGMLMSPITTVTSGMDDTSLDAGFYEPVEIGNFVWEDTNGNGIQDNGEPAIQGVDVTISGTTGDGTDITTLVPNATIQTDPNGAYLFEDLPPGTYKVTCTTPTSMTPTFANVNTNGNDLSDSDMIDMGGMLMSPTTTVPSGMVDTTLDAGFYIPVKIGNFVWEDYNANGIQDANEPGIQGVDVTISGTAGNGEDVANFVPNTTIQTGANGDYCFNNLPPGTYQVTFAQPTDMIPTLVDDSDNNGLGDDSDDSDADPNNGLMSELVTVTSGNDNNNLDAGFYGEDFGDNPNGFATTEGDDGPRHVIQPNKYLGAGVDSDADGNTEGQSGTTTGGDDNTTSMYSKGTVTNGDDEDGIAFITPMIPNHEACIEVTYTAATGTNYLTGWIDFNGNDAFDTNEQLLFKNGATTNADQLLTNGIAQTVQYCFDVPADATFDGGETHTRFRMSCETGVQPTGQLIGGEVEDYYAPFAKVGNLVWRDYEFAGDQDEPTYAGFNGVDVQLVWTNPNGGTTTYTTTTANLGGEDGLYCFYGVIPGDYTVQIPTIPAGFESTKTDFTGNEYNDSDGTAVTFNIPNNFNQPLGENGTADTPTGDNYPDDRDNLTFDFGFIAFDFGDLPNGFPTKVADTGANHSIIPDMCLGTAVDSETDGVYEAHAGFDGVGGDDNTASDFIEGTLTGTSDEDGVKFVTPMIPGNEACVEITAKAPVGGAFINAWIDFNGNNTFAGDADDQLTFTTVDGNAVNSTDMNVPMSAAPVTYKVCFNVPTTAVFDGGETHVRFRMSEAGGISFDDFAVGGEVEDYWMPFAKVGNYVWYDANYNGQQDEVLIEGHNGAMVMLRWEGEDGDFNTGDEVEYMTTTTTINGIDGKYCFLGLTEDRDYQIELMVPDGYTSTKELNSGNAVNDSNSPMVEFRVNNPINTNPTGENGTGDAPGTSNNFPDAQDDLTFDFGIVAFDFGDLPETFATTSGNNGAYHVINKGMYLGSCVDSDPEGSPAPLAGFDNISGDDLSPSAYVEGTSLSDDEDGLKFLTPMIPGEEACIHVTSTMPVGSTGKINFWIDYDGDATFSGDANEQVVFTSANGSSISTTNATVADGAAIETVLCFDVPEVAIFNGGETHFRIRLSPSGNLSFDGEGIGGEVEDYYRPLAKVGSLAWLDYNADGIQNEPADAGWNGMPVTLTAPGFDGILGTGDDIQYIVETADNAAGEPGTWQFCGLIEGDYTVEIDPEGLIPTDEGIGAEDVDSDPLINPFTVNHTADGYLTNEAGMNEDPTGGSFPDDHNYLAIDNGFLAFDYGDLPDAFATTLNSDGARHVVATPLFLGSCVDIEAEGNVDPMAGGGTSTIGDDHDIGVRTLGTCGEPGNDEDGITLLTPLIPGKEACIEVTSNAPDGSAILNAWIDFAGNGQFAGDAPDQVVFTAVDNAPINTTDAPVAQGSQTTRYKFVVPSTAIYDGGEVHIRYRLSTAGGLNFTGMALDGEVEDYWYPLAKVGNHVAFDADLEGDQNEPAMQSIDLNGFEMNLTIPGDDGIFGTADDVIFDQLTYNENGVDGKYLFCGLIPGTYRVGYPEFPEDMIPAIPDHTGDDSNDSDGLFEEFIVPEFPMNFPTAENGTGDPAVLINNFPDEQVNFQFDFLFMPEPRIGGALTISGVDFASSGTCGQMNAIFDLTIKNPEIVDLNNLQVNLNFSDPAAFGATFIALAEAPQILPISDATTLPTLNAGFNGDGNLFNGTSGLLEFDQSITIRFTVEIDPDATNAPNNPQIQATVTGGGVNNSGVEIPDLINGGQFMATDATDSGTDPCANNNGQPGDSGGSDDPTPLTDCFNAAAQPACNDHIQVSLDETGVATIFGDMIVENLNAPCAGGNLPLGDYYDIEITNNQGQSFGNMATCDMIGGTFTVMATNIANCNACWGSISVEDKLPPVLNCSDATIACTADPDLVPAPTATDNCDANPTITLVDEVTNTNNNCDAAPATGAPFTVTIVRTYLAIDQYGNTSETCQQVITVIRPDEIDIPDDLVWSCEQYATYDYIIDPARLMPSIANQFGGAITTFANTNAWDLTDIALTDARLTSNVPGETRPTGSGVPSGNFPLANGNANPLGGDLGEDYCKYTYSHEDQVLATCGFDASLDSPVFKIVRTWTILDWCTGNVITDPALFAAGDDDNVQIIKVVDDIAPIVSGIDVTVSANIAGQHPQACTSTGPIPNATATDNCTGVVGFSAFIYDFDPIANPLAQPVATVENGLITPALPVGTFFLVYTAEDGCGNIAQSTTYTLTIIDDIVPVAICDEITQVSLSSDGQAVVYAETFDDGSYDNCCLDRFEVRRMAQTCGVLGNTTFDNDGHPNDANSDPDDGAFVTFCCTDIDNDNTVVLRVFDCAGNYNECMVQVLVEDKLAPTITCPPNATLTCDEYADDLATVLLACTDGGFAPAFANEDACQSAALTAAGYGSAVGFDNCEVSITPTVTVTIDQCGAGSVVRSFVATDGNSNNAPASCTQTISITHVSDWVVQFPADQDGFCDEAEPEFGEPEIFFETCELIAISFDDQFFDVVPDACFKIVRTWTVINWCVVGADIDQEANAIELSEQQINQDLDGDGDRDNRTFRDSWRGGPSTQDNDPDNDTWDGYITYQQVIKIIDDEAPVIDPLFTVNDQCIVDGDGITCTFSGILPTPEYDDCTLDVNGNIDNNGQIVDNELTIVATVFDANGSIVSNSVVVTDLEQGCYVVRYVAIDRCGNTTATDYDFCVNDCKFPTPYCKDGIVLELMHVDDPNNPGFIPMVELWATDLDAGSFDNCPGGVELSFSETNLVSSLTYTCDNIGENEVNLYVTDAAGNTDFCTTFVIIQANQDQCGLLDDPQIAGNIMTETNDGVENVEVFVNSTSNFSVNSMTNAAGQFNFNVPSGNDYTVTPYKDDNHLNGVTTFDLVKISKHILNIESLDSPYKMIAADANNSTSITTLDLVHIRKLILHIDEAYANNSSWRFVDANYVFPDAQNPWQEAFPEIVNLNDLTTNNLSNDFVAVKIGDVNGNAQTNGLLGTDDRTFNGALIFAANDQLVEAGDVVTIDFTANNFNVFGYQFTLNFDTEKLTFRSVNDGLAQAQNFGLTKLEKGIITTSWNDSEAKILADDAIIFSLTFEATETGKLSEMIHANGRYTQAEAYQANGDLLDVLLTFNSNTDVFELYQNTPNPFDKATTIGFQLPYAGEGILTVFDVNGKIVLTQIDNYETGYNQINIDEKQLGANGIYYYQLKTADYTAMKAMMLNR